MATGVPRKRLVASILQCRLMCADFQWKNFVKNGHFLQKTLDIKIFFRTKEPSMISFLRSFFRQTDDENTLKRQRR